jgi:Ni,Fe-hydrogenase III large subunit/NADH:ubiquinone oxidoreductase subunit C
MDYLSVKNNEAVSVKRIPVLNYPDFLEYNTGLKSNETIHCIQYFGYRLNNTLTLICCMANDSDGSIYITSSKVPAGSAIAFPSFTRQHFSFHIFERELHENFGINYSDHPWLKPVRYSYNRTDKDSVISRYPYRRFESDELHEVGVGPIHAGIIEPGHFRFICSGEQILHLEIQHGYQHRGIEQLMLQKKKLLERNILAESIAGDSVAGHTTAFANLWESLCGFASVDDIQYSRTIALEWERIAIHTGDLSAICNDIAYQLGSSVFGRLRTPIINSFQYWCGNRFAKNLIRAGYNQYPFTRKTADFFLKVLDEFEPDYIEMYRRMKSLSSVLARLEKTGIVTKEQASEMGTVGMSARMCDINRDIRASHPYGLYTGINHKYITKHHGDVYSRTQIRNEDILQSIGYVRHFIDILPNETVSNNILADPKPDTFSLSLVEGWRGEICHCAITDEKGDLLVYKIKDPSLHNWVALSLAVRNNEISDFPVCNKSFNLSYCGYDL